MRQFVLGINLLLIFSTAFAANEKKEVTPSPQKVGFYCAVDESSKSANTEHQLFRFIFDTIRYPALQDPRKSIMSHDVWLEDGRTVMITEIDTVNAPKSSWVPAFLQRDNKLSRDYFLSITWFEGEKMDDKEVARIPVEELFAAAPEQTKVIDLGAIGKGDLAWLLKCRELK